jgi:hypothetical protein
MVIDFSGFFVILVMNLGPFVASLFTESWQYLPPEVYVLQWRTGIVMTSLPVAFVLPTFPLLFSSSSQHPKLDISGLLAKQV